MPATRSNVYIKLSRYTMRIKNVLWVFLVVVVVVAAAAAVAVVNRNDG